jgi:hypothetical protein
VTAAERHELRRAFDACPADEQQRIRNRLQALLEGRRWTFARTMASNPHWWSARKDWPSDADFLWCCTYINVLGTSVKFGRSYYIQLTLGRHFYWSMSPCSDVTRILNRKVVTETPLPFEA